MPGRIQVLHVDDDPSLLDLTAEFLEREDDRFALSTATSVDEGLDYLKDCPPDCIISDYDMPRQNGIEFLENVREEYSELPFILFTGKGSEEVASNAISNGATDYLHKGSGTDQYELLANRIRNAVQGHRAAREVERQQDLMSRAEILGSIGGWELHYETQNLRMTKGLKKLYGLDEDQDLSLAEVVGLYDKDSQETIKRIIEEAVRTGYAEAADLHFQRVDGEQRIAEGNAELVENTDDETILRGAIRDVTGRKEREHELEQTRDWYRTLLDAAPDAVFVADAESGTIRETNQAATRLLDRPREEIVGMHQTELHPPQKIEKYAEIFENYVTAGPGRTEAFGAEAPIYVIDTEGERIPVEINARMTEIDDENVIQGYFRDITDRKEREQELRRQNERMEEFTSIVSHDLRNPLNVAEGHLKLAQETCESEDISKAADAIDRSQALIADLLTLAQEGEAADEVEPVALADVAESSWQTVESRSATLEIHATRTLQADQSRLKQLFENLYRNAIEHGGDDVTVSVGTTDGGFYVADTGPGIPEDDREGVFKTGYSTNEEGTGFGLRIVTQVVEAHGWDIRVTDSNDNGARFEVTGVDTPE